MEKTPKVRFDYDEKLHNVLISQNLDGNLDFLNNLPTDVKTKIYEEMDSIENSDYVFGFFCIGGIGYIAIYRYGTVEKTTIYVCDKKEDLIKVITERPIHKSKNKEIVQMIESYA